jgi:hypothetical protein
LAEPGGLGCQLLSLRLGGLRSFGGGRGIVMALVDLVLTLLSFRLELSCPGQRIGLV